MTAYLGFTLGSQVIGEITEGFSAVIGGSTRVVSTEPGEFSIVDRLSAASEATLYVRGFVPAEFSDVKLYNGGTGGTRLFCGTVITPTYDAVRLGDEPWHQLQCQDYTWLINRYKRVRGIYSGIGINTCLRQVLASFTDGGFTVGYCPSSLGNVTDLVFEDATVTDVLDQLAEIADGFWDVDGDKRVHIFTDPDHLSTDSITLDASSKNFSGLKVTRDGTEIATRVIVHGAAVQVTSLTSSASTTLPVEECSPFVGASTTSGSVFVNGMAIAYTGVSVTSGPGNLTGVTGLTADVPQGASAQVRVVVEDGTAQSDLATLLGGGLSGIAEITVQSSGANIDGCTGLANSILATRKASQVQLSYRTQDQVHTGAQGTVPGQVVSVSLSSPSTVSGDFRVQSVDIGVKQGGKVAGTTLGFERRVNLAPYNRVLRTGRILTRR